MRKIALILVSFLTVFSLIGISTPAQAATKKKITNTVSVPSLKTSAKIDTRYGGIKRGAMTIPNNTNFAMYKYGAKPGDRRGTVVLASHINHGSTRGPLYNHAKLKKGSLLYVYDAKGVKRTYKLTRKRIINKSSLPAGYFTKKGQHRLVLFTCGGKLLTKKGGGRTFQSNIILEYAPVK